MNDEELIARAREVGAELCACSNDRDRLAGWLLRELAGRLDGPAPVIGYLIDGKLWHPSDVTIVRQGAAQAAEDRPPRITVRHHFTPAHAVQATADSHG